MAMIVKLKLLGLSQSTIMQCFQIDFTFSMSSKASLCRFHKIYTFDNENLNAFLQVKALYFTNLRSVF